MLSRALSLATVMLLIGCLSVKPALAQATNLEAGKSPSQIFAGTCTACHKSPRGLLKTVPAGSLPGFLRQHYTTSPEMASLLSGFLVSNGATDTRYSGNPGKDAKSDAKPEAKPGGPAEQLDRFGHRLRPAATQEAAKPQTEPQQAAKPDADGRSPQGDDHHGRNAKRLARPGEAPDAAKPAVEVPATPVQAATEGGPEGRKTSAKQKLSKRGRPGSEEPPKIDAAKTDAGKTDAAKTDAAKEEPAKGDAVKDDTPKEAAKETAKETTGGAPKEALQDTSKSETAKVEGSKLPGEGKSESAKIEAPKGAGGGEAPVLRADPVPPVTPAPPASPAVSAAISGSAQQPAAESSAPPPAVTASVPPPQVTPPGPPAPPISQ
jgi:hypothetical protein